MTQNIFVTTHRKNKQTKKLVGKCGILFGKASPQKTKEVTKIVAMESKLK